MPSFGYPPLFIGSVANAATQYVGVPVGDASLVGLHIAWKDATSSATITLETSDFPADEAPVSEAGAAWEWKDTGETITGPAGSAAGSTTVQLGNIGNSRARLKIVAAANSVFEIRATRKL